MPTVVVLFFSGVRAVPADTEGPASTESAEQCELPEVPDIPSVSILHVFTIGSLGQCVRYR